MSGSNPLTVATARLLNIDNRRDIEIYFGVGVSDGTLIMQTNPPPHHGRFHQEFLILLWSLPACVLATWLVLRDHLDDLERFTQDPEQATAAFYMLLIVVPASFWIILFPLLIGLRLVIRYFRSN